MSYIDLVQLPIVSSLETGDDEDQVTILWWASRKNKAGEGGSKSRVMFVVPGNPGIPEYYTEFLDYLHKQTCQQLDIIIVGHLGHSIATSSNRQTKNVKNKVYALEEQVQHKQACFKKIVEKYPQGTEFFLVGHSIGAWICEQIFKQNSGNNIVQVYSLFPAICDFQDSPYGYWMSKTIFQYNVRILLVFLVSLLTWIPPKISTALLCLLCQNETFASITTRKLLNPSVVLNCLSMANDETRQVCDLDRCFYQCNYDKFMFYYTPSDGFAPTQYFENLKDEVPRANAILGSHRIPHIFVLNHSRLMASLLAHWLKPFIQ